MKRILGLMAGLLVLAPVVAFAASNPNDSCAGFFLCAQTCGATDQACQQGCAPSDAGEMGILNTLSQCVQASCAGNQTPACINANCKADYDACFAKWAGNPDGTCAGFQMCTQSCATPDQACAQSCAPTDQGELGLVNTLSQCLQTNCAAGATPQCLVANCLDDYVACLDGGAAPGGCGAVTADGECDGDVLRVCVADAVVETDCAAAGKECTFSGHAPAECTDIAGPGEDTGSDEPDAGGTDVGQPGDEDATGDAVAIGDDSAGTDEDGQGGFNGADTTGGTGGTDGTGGNGGAGAIGTDGDSGGCSSTTAPGLPAGAALLMALALIALRRRTV